MDLHVGRYAGADGTVTIHGANSVLDGQRVIRIGDEGEGRVTVSAGGQIESVSHSYLGYASTGEGTATVTGAGSKWTSKGRLRVGYSGTGTMTISDGGQVHSWTYSRVGEQSGSNGTVTITGINSKWISDQHFSVGHNGTGTLDIENGGHAKSTSDSYLGYYADGTGTATVTGANSKWTSESALYIGRSGTGTLTLTDGGTAKSTNATTLAVNAGSTGTLNIGAAEGQAAAAVGVLDAPSLVFGAGAGTLVFNHINTAASPYDFTVNMSGDGIIKALAGATVLSGDLSGFTGTTAVDDAASLCISGAYGGDMTVDDNSSAEIVAAVGGNLTVNNNSSIHVRAPVSGNATIGSGSTLAANDTVSGTVTVNHGGTLKGTGTVGATTANSGAIVAPGNSIGTLNVAGDVNFGSGSFYDVEVNAAGQSDKIVATGQANLTGGTVRVLPESGTYSVDTRYTIIEATGGVNGTFADVTLSSSSLFLQALLSYDANNVYTTLARNSISFASHAASMNQAETARGLDSLAGTNSANALIANQSTTAGVQSALAALSGELHANIRLSMLEDAHLMTDALSSRLRQSSKGVWAQMLGDWRSRDGGAEVAGFNRHLKGVMFGADKPITPDRRLGFAVSYTHSRYNQKESNDYRGDAHSLSAAVYGLQIFEEISLYGGLGYGWHDIDTRRVVQQTGFSDYLSAHYRAHTFHGFGEAAAHMKYLEPFARISYSYLQAPTFREKGGDAALEAKDQGTPLGQTTLGLRTKAVLPTPNKNAKAVLTGSIGWLHTIGKNAPDTKMAFKQGMNFTATPAQTARDAFTLETGITLAQKNGFRLGVSYNAKLAPRTSAHGAKININWTF